MSDTLTEQPPDLPEDGSELLEDGHEPLEDDAERDGPTELDPEVRARREAALSQVRSFGDPVLRSAALPVERFDERLRDEVARMGRLMNDSLGIGLAATQLGVLNRVLVYRVQSEAPVLGLVNPTIDWSGSELEIMEEGCLSLPGVRLDVERPVHVRVRARDVDGEQMVIEASGLEARVIQHEIDHLDGVLILDRVSREERKQAMREIREAAERAEQAA
jgi:peptide deformylase